MCECLTLWCSVWCLLLLNTDWCLALCECLTLWCSVWCLMLLGADWCLALEPHDSELYAHCCVCLKYMMSRSQQTPQVSLGLVLHRAVLRCTVLHCTALSCPVPSCTVCYHGILCCGHLNVHHTLRRCTTILYCTLGFTAVLLCCATQINTALVSGAGTLPAAGPVSEVQSIEAAAVARGVPAHPADHEVSGLNHKTYRTQDANFDKKKLSICTTVVKPTN